jgi:hypothetical protein
LFVVIVRDKISNFFTLYVGLYLLLIRLMALQRVKEQKERRASEVAKRRSSRKSSVKA